MVSYNNITKLTYYYENKLYNEILDLVFELCNSEALSNLVEVDWSVPLNQGKSLLKKEPKGF